MEKPVRKVCPPPEDLSVVLNDLRCEECSLHFRNLARYRMHNLKVHEKKDLTKTGPEDKEVIHYHCPVKTCVYAIDCERFFTKQRYLKQVRNKSIFFTSITNEVFSRILTDIRGF